MASGDMQLSNHVATGTVTGTGSNINVLCGFKPKAVWLYNITGEAILHWSSLMPDAAGYKGNGLATGSNANESSHTHAVALDGGVSDATSGGTPAGTITGALELTVAAFSGVGITAAGQVMTTTDNPVVGLNAAAGMWLYGATGTNGPVLVLSNTAGTGVAPVAFTVQGAAFTDAGAYKVVTMGAATFTGSALGTHTHGPGTLADAASGTGSAHTHTFTGGAADQAYITSGGITPLYNGFTIGTDTDVNVNTEVIDWVAVK